MALSEQFVLWFWRELHAEPSCCGCWTIAVRTTWPRRHVDGRSCWQAPASVLSGKRSFASVLAAASGGPILSWNDGGSDAARGAYQRAPGDRPARPARADAR